VSSSYYVGKDVQEDGCDAVRGGPQPASPHSSTELRYLILGLQREGNRQLTQYLRELGITPSQAEIISVLSDREPLTLADLGRHIVCETGSPSRLVGTLVTYGLITRKGSKSDRRAVQLRLSPKGRALLASIRAVDEHIGQHVAERLSQEECAVTVTALYRLLEGTTTGTKLALRFQTTS
jgi:DNA-binding MarR family transcriptional regulator